MYGVNNNNDKRSIIQNKLWGLKFVILSALSISSFFINNPFFIIWNYIGLVGAFIFLIIQPSLIFISILSSNKLLEKIKKSP